MKRKIRKNQFKSKCILRDSHFFHTLYKIWRLQRSSSGAVKVRISMEYKRFSKTSFDKKIIEKKKLRKEWFNGLLTKNKKEKNNQFQALFSQITAKITTQTTESQCVRTNFQLKRTNFTHGLLSVSLRKISSEFHNKVQTICTYILKNQKVDAEHFSLKSTLSGWGWEIRIKFQKGLSNLATFRAYQF